MQCSMLCLYCHRDVHPHLCGFAALHACTWLGCSRCFSGQLVCSILISAYSEVAQSPVHFVPLPCIFTPPVCMWAKQSTSHFMLKDAMDLFGLDGLALDSNSSWGDCVVFTIIDSTLSSMLGSVVAAWQCAVAVLTV